MVVQYNFLYSPLLTYQQGDSLWHQSSSDGSASSVPPAAPAAAGPARSCWDAAPRAPHPPARCGSSTPSVEHGHGGHGGPRRDPFNKSEIMDSCAKTCGYLRIYIYIYTHKRCVMLSFKPSISPAFGVIALTPYRPISYIPMYVILHV